MQSIWWQVFDILGTTAFALSGVLAAIFRRMDLFGVFVLAAATAVGGGIVRDVLLGSIPPAAFKTSLYLWIILATMLLCSIGVRYIRMSSHRRATHYGLIIYICCDAVGLGSFTVTGTLLGCFYYPNYWILCVTLGVLTAAVSFAMYWQAAFPVFSSRRFMRRLPLPGHWISGGCTCRNKCPWIWLPLVALFLR